MRWRIEPLHRGLAAGWPAPAVKKAGEADQSGQDVDAMHLAKPTASLSAAAAAMLHAKQ